MDSLETKLSCLGGQAPLILTFREETSVLDRKLAFTLFPCCYPLGSFQSISVCQIICKERKREGEADVGVSFPPSPFKRYCP